MKTKAAITHLIGGCVDLKICNSLKNSANVMPASFSVPLIDLSVAIARIVNNLQLSPSCTSA